MSKESVYYILDNLGGKEDVKILKQELDSLPGVISVSVNTLSGRLAVDFDSTGTKRAMIEDKLKELNFTASSVKEENHIM